jgi:hypothetical protein
VKEVEAKSTSAEFGQPVFDIDGCVTIRTVALRRPIYTQKKGRLAISIGLNYSWLISTTMILSL